MILGAVLASIFLFFSNFSENAKTSYFANTPSEIGVLAFPNLSFFHQFSTDFPCFFMSFPEPSPEGVLGGPKCPSILKRSVLVPFRVFGGAQNRPLGAPFSLEKSILSYPADGPNALGTDPAPHEPPKTPRNAFFSILDRF